MKEKENVRSMVDKVSDMLTFTVVDLPKKVSEAPIATNMEFVSDKKQNNHNNEKRISGNITDKHTQKPLQGVNVIIKDSHNGTVSDAEGNFSLTANTGDLLELSFIGYSTVKLEVSDLPKNVGTIEMSRKIVKLNSIHIGLYTTCDSGNNPLKNYLPQKTKTIDNNDNEEVVFVMVEKMPEFPGGESAMLKYISKNISYPATSAEKNIQGEVLCRFIVKEDGKVGNVKVLKGVDPDLDDEAIRVLYTMPRWKPGEQRGKKVPVEYSIPVVFSIQQGN
jgi:TonB family protein